MRVVMRMMRMRRTMATPDHRRPAVQPDLHQEAEVLGQFDETVTLTESDKSLC